MFNQLTDVFFGGFVQIAERLAGLIDALVSNGMNLQDVTIVGHSLGSHSFQLHFTHSNFSIVFINTFAITRLKSANEKSQKEQKKTKILLVLTRFCGQNFNAFFFKFKFIVLLKLALNHFRISNLE